jgi:hypothetical protein
MFSCYYLPFFWVLQSIKLPLHHVNFIFKLKILYFIFFLCHLTSHRSCITCIVESSLVTICATCFSFEEFHISSTLVLLCFTWLWDYRLQCFPKHRMYIELFSVGQECDTSVCAVDASDGSIFQMHAHVMQCSNIIYLWQPTVLHKLQNIC